MEGDEALDLEFGEPAIDPLESGILDTDTAALNAGLHRGDLDPQALYRRRSWATTFGREPMDPTQHGVTFGIEVTPKKSFKNLAIAAGGGALVGFFVAGPPGALGGLILGAVAEEGYERLKPHPVAALPPPSPAPAPVVVPAAAAPTAPPAPAAAT